MTNSDHYSPRPFGLVDRFLDTMVDLFYRPAVDVTELTFFQENVASEVRNLKVKEQGDSMLVFAVSLVVLVTSVIFIFSGFPGLTASEGVVWSRLGGGLVIASCLYSLTCSYLTGKKTLKSRYWVRSIRVEDSDELPDFESEN